MSFNVGDRIEIVKRTQNAEDWWTGRLNGQEGVFPGTSRAKYRFIRCSDDVCILCIGNYVQES